MDFIRTIVTDYSLNESPIFHFGIFQITVDLFTVEYTTPRLLVV